MCTFKWLIVMFFITQTLHAQEQSPGLKIAIFDQRGYQSSATLGSPASPVLDPYWTSRPKTSPEGQQRDAIILTPATPAIGAPQKFSLTQLGQKNYCKKLCAFIKKKCPCCTRSCSPDPNETLLLADQQTASKGIE